MNVRIGREKWAIHLKGDSPEIEDAVRREIGVCASDTVAAKWMNICAPPMPHHVSNLL